MAEELEDPILINDTEKRFILCLLGRRNQNKMIERLGTNVAGYRSTL